MTVPTITNPKGIDKQIAKVQSYLNTNLWLSPLTYNVFARAYVIEGKPHVYQGGKDYEELLLDDKVDAHSLFLVTGDSDRQGGYSYTAPVDILFFVNLKTCYSSVLHRADENAVTDILDLLSADAYSYQITGIARSTEAFEGLEGFDVRFDMSDWAVIRIKGTLKYQYEKPGC